MVYKRISQSLRSLSHTNTVFLAENSNGFKIAIVFNEISNYKTTRSLVKLPAYLYYISILNQVLLDFEW